MVDDRRMTAFIAYARKTPKSFDRIGGSLVSLSPLNRRLKKVRRQMGSKQSGSRWRDEATIKTTPLSPRMNREGYGRVVRSRSKWTVIE